MMLLARAISKYRPANITLEMLDTFVVILSCPHIVDTDIVSKRISPQKQSRLANKNYSTFAMPEGRVGRQSEGSTGDATTDESRELAAGEPGRRSEGKDGRATLDASWESAAGRAGRSDDRLDCDANEKLQACLDLVRRPVAQPPAEAS
jgi:hypothetical protein